MPTPPSIVRPRRGEGLLVGGVGGLVAGIGTALLAWRYISPYHLLSPVVQAARWLYAAPATRERWIAELAAAHILTSYMAAPAVGLIAGAVAGIYLYRAAARSRDDLIHVRGRTLSGSVKEVAAEARAAGGHYGDIQLAPAVLYPFAMLVRSIYMVGAPGSGKTVSIVFLLLQLIRGGCKIFLVDVKGDFTSHVLAARPNRLAIIAPWDKRSTTWWIARDLRTLLDARRFAASLIPTSGSDPMWSNAARAVLISLIEKLRVEHGEAWGWRDLAEVCRAPFDVLKAAVDTHFPDAARIVEQASRTTQGVLINMVSFLQPVFDMARAEAEARGRISLRDWLHGTRYADGQIIISQNSARFSALATPVNSAMVEFIAAEVASPSYSEESAKPLAIVLDELPQLQRLDGLLPLLEVGRSKKVSCILAAQDHAQLEAIYGRERARTIPAMCGVTITFRVGAESAQWASESLGDREVERAQMHSAAVGARGPAVTHTRERVRVMLPAEFEQLRVLKRGVEGILNVRGWRRAYRLTWPFPSPEDWRTRRPPSIEAAWVSAPASPSATASNSPPTSDSPPSSAGTTPLPDATAEAESEEIVEEVETTTPPQVDDVPASQLGPEAEAEHEDELAEKGASEIVSRAIDAVVPGLGTALDMADEITAAGNESTPAPPAMSAPAQGMTAEQRRKWARKKMLRGLQREREREM